tara:strand:+ start:205 stop:420 length:216 start_codon:yes stop_codon:yes gene_type:complete
MKIENLGQEPIKKFFPFYFHGEKELQYRVVIWLLLGLGHIQTDLGTWLTGDSLHRSKRFSGMKLGKERINV